MFRSLHLGKLFGIDLFIHGTFWLLPLFVLFSGTLGGSSAEAVGLDLAVIFTLFGCVALHEVGHALAARYYGIGTRDITLYPIGGIASLERMPEKPGQEIAIALAGPAVNIVIAGGLFFGLLAASIAIPGSWSPANVDVFDVFIARVFWANVLLAGFNLLPAFPMDGGRVFRALLGIRLPRVRATEIAVFVSGLMALAFFLLGMLASNLSLMILAVVVFLLGKAELVQVRYSEAAKTWNQRVSEFFQQPEAATDSFSGWKFDPVRRVWTEWRDGQLIREVNGF